MFDLIVIGGGPGGYAAAEFAAKKGMNVALVERDRLGGTCLHRGCIPTKTYLHTAEVVREATSLFPANPLPIDRAEMLRHKNEIVDTLTDGVASLLKAAKVSVYVGSATLASTSAPFQVTVADNDGSVESLEAQHVLLAAGSVPARLPVPGCDNPAVWTSDDLLGERGTEPFQSLLMIGGGVIGVEMASIYAGLGVSVTILEAEARCLPMMDTELGRSAEMLLKSRGVTVLTGARLQKITPTDTGFTAAYEKNGITDEVTSERVLLATGRVPATSELLADGVSLAMNRRFIAVNTQYQTSVPGIYAIGDINGQNQLAHAAHAQGVAAVSAMLGITSPIDPTLVPSCVYTAPEIASVGLTQDEAKAQNRDVAIGKALTTQNARTLIEGLGRGFIKLLFDRQTHVLLGAQLFCGRATDIAGELALALQNGLTAEAMMRTLRAHPTFEEAVTDAISAVKF